MQPKDKCDSKWLRDAGYGGIEQFMISYGYKMHDTDDYQAAKRLIAGFRAEQQEDWENKRKAKTTRTNAREIELAQLWHQRMDHLDYHAVKRLPSSTIGVPNFTFNVDDIPVCTACASTGISDR
jgi:hypothetical protein